MNDGLVLFGCALWLLIGFIVAIKSDKEYFDVYWRIIFGTITAFSWPIGV